jgi:Ca2+-binding RTX toxin-like protein
LLGLLPATASAAVPTCNGQTATIYTSPFTGTAGADVIVGSDLPETIDGGDGRDVICGGGGKDTVLGGPKADLIFGEAGSDELHGEGGEDEIHGGRGFDLIRGEGENDDIWGDRGVDNCLQGAGNGIVATCEVADLKVTVSSPATSSDGDVTFTVKVKNLGPDESPYKLSLDEENNEATCNGPQPWEGVTAYGLLDPGESRVRTFDVSCTINDVGSWVQVVADVNAMARDPGAGNDEGFSRTDLIQ